MMRHVDSGPCSCILPIALVSWRPQESPIHGRQDKSADRGRAHVVGGIEVSANPSRRDAGARARKASDINGPSAISPINAKGRRP
jgi:hypothetical protein